MTRQSVATLREGGESHYRYQSLRSVEERNVAGRNVQQINSNHDSGSKLRRTFGPGGDAAHCQWHIHRHHPHGSRFCCRRVSRRIPAWRSIHLYEGGREREPVERASAGRHVCQLKTSHHRSELVAGTAADPSTASAYTNASTGPRSRERGIGARTSQKPQRTSSLQRGRTSVSVDNSERRQDERSLSTWMMFSEDFKGRISICLQIPFRAFSLAAMPNGKPSANYLIATRTNMLSVHSDCWNESIAGTIRTLTRILSSREHSCHVKIQIQGATRRTGLGRIEFS